MSDLVGTHEHRFSCNAADFLFCNILSTASLQEAVISIFVDY